MDVDLLIPCDGGPSGWRRVPDPPPVEIEVAGGVLVLDDSDAHQLRSCTCRADAVSPE